MRDRRGWFITVDWRCVTCALDLTRERPSKHMARVHPTEPSTGTQTLVATTDGGFATSRTYRMACGRVALLKRVYMRQKARR
jgi:hypothetical protein